MGNRRRVLWGLLLGLVVAVVAGALIGGMVGAVSMAGLVVVLMIAAGLARLVYRLRPQRRFLRAIRGAVVTVLLLVTALIGVEGVVSVVRFTGDGAGLPNDRYVVVIVADGASLIQARELVMEGLDDRSDYAKATSDNFPNISKLFLTNGAFTANGISVWPSSSIPAHTGIMTGAYPRHTGVMGQRQSASSKRRYTSYIGLGILSHRSILSPMTKTLYEYFPRTRSVDVLQVVNRGCSLYVPGTPEDEQVVQRTCQVVDATSALSRFSGRSEMPRILVMTLPGIDHVTHNSSFTTEKALKAYLDIDRYVGEIADLYRRKGIFDKTLFVLAADHGMGPVSNHLTIDNLMHDMRFTTYESFKWTAVPAWGSFEANFWVGARRKFDHEYNCMPLWGGNSDALLYIKGQNVRGGRITRQSWDFRNTDQELERYVVGGTQIDVIRRLLDYSPGIGLIFTNPEPDTFHVYSIKGKAEILERRRDGRLEFRYRVLTGDDPLGYQANPAIRAHIDKGDWLSDHEWLRLTYLEHYPDAIRRIAYSMQHPNAGTMHIVAADDWDFAPYYVAKNVLVGSHGSLNQQQSLVPIMFHGPGVRHVELPYARTVDIMPTILAYLGVSAKNTDGRPLPIFEDERKNGKVSAFAPGSTIEDGERGYSLESAYASYDQRIVRIDRKTGKREVLIPSTRAAFPELRGSPNAVLECAGIQGDDLLLRVVYVGEKRKGAIVRVKATSAQR